MIVLGHHFSVPCPTCKATVGERCRDLTLKTDLGTPIFTYNPHRTRERAYSATRSNNAKPRK